VGRNGEEWLPSSNSIPPPWIVWLGVPFKMPVSRGARIVSRKPLAHSVADTVVEGAAFCRRQRNPVPPDEVFSLRRLWQNRRPHAKSGGAFHCSLGLGESYHRVHQPPHGSARPFAWTKNADEILAFIDRFYTRTITAPSGTNF
jgi:hypothetical protein